MNAAHVIGGVCAAVAGIAVIGSAWFMAGTPDAVLDDELLEQPTPGERGEEVTYTLEPGTSAGAAGSALAELGVIESGNRFQLLVDLMDVGGQLQPDTYLLYEGMSTASVIDRMVTGDVAPSVRLTFPEGTRIEEMAEIVDDSGLATAEEFLEAVEEAEPPPSLAAMIPEGQGLQGFLFPDTYILPQTAGAETLVDLMLRTMNLRFAEGLRQAAIDRGLTPYEAITLASIIEREAVIPEERAMISSVFHNRLENDDVLGADPTVQYVAALDPENVEEYGWWKPGRELTQEELNEPHPYNTRVTPGLPPGPIANPGLASIEAAVNPAETDYYYFVANSVEGDGSHVFAETAEEHEANVDRYHDQ